MNTVPVSSAWPAHLRQTYSILRPAGERWWQPATCEDIDCAAFLHGWSTTLQLEAHAAQVHYIRRESGRRFTEHMLRSHPAAVRFDFPAGQRCFRASEHQVPVEREPLYVVRGGDSRAWTGARRVHRSAEDWRDDFGENQDRLSILQQRKG